MDGAQLKVRQWVLADAAHAEKSARRPIWRNYMPPM
jgi:hypothetical protein